MNTAIQFFGSTVNKLICNPELPLQSETTAYISRVEADGGVVNDPYFVNAFYYTVKGLGLLESMWYAVYPQAGVKLRVSGVDQFVTKIYDLSPNNHDAVSGIESRQPFLLQSYNTRCNSIYSIYNGGRIFAEGGVRTMIWELPGKLFVQNQQKITSIYSYKVVTADTGGQVFYVTTGSSAGARYNISIIGSSAPNILSFAGSEVVGQVKTRIVSQNLQEGTYLLKSKSEHLEGNVPISTLPNNEPLFMTLLGRVLEESNAGQSFTQHVNGLIGMRDIISVPESEGILEFLDNYFGTNI